MLYFIISFLKSDFDKKFIKKNIFSLRHGRNRDENRGEHGLSALQKGHVEAEGEYSVEKEL